MRNKQYIENSLRQALEQKNMAWTEKILIEPPKDSGFGDLASNVALVLAGQIKTNPRQLAEELKQELLIHAREIEKIDVAGPGFLNFTFKKSWLQQVASLVLQEADKYGQLTTDRGKKIQIEYVSANPTGPLHIGHGRGAALGDSLARILRFAGYEVSTEYYLNDAGRQMHLLGTATWVRLQQLCGRDIELPEDCYRGDYIRDIAQLVLDEHGKEILNMDEKAAIAICGQKAMEEILSGIKKDLTDFRVEHQHWFSEKSLVDSGEVEATLNRLREQGLAYEQDGALWFKSTDYGDDKDRVLRKSSGLLTYFASDIAYHAHKLGRKFDMLIDIWGADHHGYVPRMQAAMTAMQAPGKLNVILVQLVNLLRNGEQIAMSTRAGEFETLHDVCAEVGVDASRFIFLFRKSDSHLDFDLEVVKQKSMENPVYYVQYAHARICSLLEKAGQGVFEGDFDTSWLDTPEDKDLLKTLEQFPDSVECCASSLSPHHISYYLQELAGKLHCYYNAHHILTDKNQERIKAKLFLFQAVAQVLRTGLTLLGVEAVQKM